MANNIVYRLMQKMTKGPDLCLLESEIRVNCLRVKAQLLEDSPSEYSSNDLSVRTYHRVGPEAQFGEGVYG